MVEVISISLYSVIFYRYYSKRKLHKSMDMRDKARSDLYLAQLRSQSAPNTPGFGPKSPAFSQYALSPRFPPQAFGSLGKVQEEGASPFTPGGRNLVEPVSAFSRPAVAPSSSFKLQAPPFKAPSATPKLGGAGGAGGAFMDANATATPISSRSTPSPPPAVTISEHGPVAPGEIQYAAVPIPGAYADAALQSQR